MLRTFVVAVGPEESDGHLIETCPGRRGVHCPRRDADSIRPSLHANKRGKPSQRASSCQLQSHAFGRHYYGDLLVVG